MTAARGIALSALVLAVLLAGYLLLFRGGSGTDYTLLFQTAGQLVRDDDVQVPILDWIGLYKSELTAFFANVVAATQARSPGTAVHYLRTTNPFNPENLAVHPRRVGSNRPNPYMRPRGSDDLPRGMAVYEDRHCGNPVPGAVNDPALLPPLPEVPTVPVPVPGLPVPVPSVVPDLPTAEQMQDLVSDDLLDRIFRFAYGSGSVPAPPCRKQAPFTYGGETTQYPHVTAGTGR